MSNDTKATLIATLITGMLISFIVALGFLLKWDATNDAKYRQGKCSEIAALASIEEYVEKDYTCYLIKDGKFESIDL